MKTTFTLILALLLSLFSIAQQGINYKALIKDGSGNVVANQNITLLFNIYEGAGMTNLVYRETHTPTTDDNGIIIINIGEGSIVSGTFTGINWGNDTHNLNTQINTGNGLVDMGTTAFKTVPYALNAANVNGLERLDEGNGMGWRLKGSDPENYGSIGDGAVDLSFSNLPSSTLGATGNNSTSMGTFTYASGGSSTAMGSNTIASGGGSTAMGSGTNASGGISTTMGWNTIASGIRSTAMGDRTIASGGNSTAMGQETNASGFGSTALGWATNAEGINATTIGEHTTAASYASLAIGRYNMGYGNNPTDWLETDPLFEIGNGSSENNKSNALTVLKNAKVGIGTATPFTPLHIEGGTDANLTNATDGFLIIGSLFGSNLVFDNNEIMARNVLSTSTLFLQHSGGSVSVGGAIVHSSDRRLKRDIQPISYGLQTILELQPKSYYWKNRPEQKQRSLGLIAQEVQPILNELVLNNEKDNMLSVNYTELIPILIKAIQDQQEIIDNLTSKATNQYEKIESQNNKYRSLLKRVEQLETSHKLN